MSVSSETVPGLERTAIWFPKMSLPDEVSNMPSNM
jgi:hypothetical protein